jgi:hypothetical protein
LLNLEFGESKLITFVFFGLPELEEYLHLDEPLAQRVALKCNLECFHEEATQGYINHRLRLAGAKAALFPSESIHLIHHYSRGIPRLINTICDNSLFEGYLLKKKTIEPELVQSVITDLGLAPIPKPVSRRGASGRAGESSPASVTGLPPSELPPPPAPPGRRTGPGTVTTLHPSPPPVLEPELPDGASLEPLEDQGPNAGAAPTQDGDDASARQLGGANSQEEIDSLLDDWEKK